MKTVLLSIYNQIWFRMNAQAIGKRCGEGDYNTIQFRAALKELMNKEPKGSAEILYTMQRINALFDYHRQAIKNGGAK